MTTDRIWATAVDESIPTGTFVSMVDYPEAPNRDARPYLLATPAREAADELLAEIKRMRDALDGIYVFANDTLSGRVDGPDDREWQRAGIVEIRNRARKFATSQSAVDARAAIAKARGAA